MDVLIPKSTPAASVPSSSSVTSTTSSAVPASTSTPSNPFGSFPFGSSSQRSNVSPSLTAASGLISAFKDKPDLFVKMLKSDPGFRNVLEKNPQMEATLNDPATVEMLIDTMSDPTSMQNLMRQNDAVMNQISEIPGGEQMLERVMNVHSPALLNSSNTTSPSTASGTRRASPDPPPPPTPPTRPWFRICGVPPPLAPPLPPALLAMLVVLVPILLVLLAMLLAMLVLEVLEVLEVRRAPRLWLRLRAC